MIAIPALGLLVVLTRPGEARSTRRQWFAGDRPQRRYVVAGFALLLLAAVVLSIST